MTMQNIKGLIAYLRYSRLLRSLEIRIWSLYRIIKWATDKENTLKKQYRTISIVKSLNPFSSPKILILVTHQRCGSTLFCNVAGQCKDVFGAYELLNPGFHSKMKFKDLSEVKLYIHMMSKREKYLVFKVFPGHLDVLNIEMTEFIMHMSDKNTHWFHLIRENVFGQFVSHEKAKNTNIWIMHNDKSSTPSKKVSVNLKDFLNYRKKVINFDENFNQLLSGDSYTLLSYESFTNDVQGRIENNFTPLINSHVSEISIPFRKQGKALEDSIVNWMQLKSNLDTECMLHPLRKN